MNYDLSRLGIEVLNAMQQDTMQAYRRSDSLVLLSPTGSGKTLAYLLPLLESLNPAVDATQALVVVPSRELALQTHQVARRLSSTLRTVPLYGGRPAMEEHRTLRGVSPHLVVGTPGRLLDHLTKGNLRADSLHTLVLDEFDKCLELGFREEMAQLFARLPHVGKRVLLSATDEPEITRFLPEYVRLDFLQGEDALSAERIAHYVVRSPEKDKLAALRRLLLSLGTQSTLVFVGYRESVERVSRYLQAEGFYASALHGGMEQRDRERALFRFVSGSANVLVSTDLASRGLDIPLLDNVVHYHLPLDRHTLVHRSGRTARWDRQGRAFLLLGPGEEAAGIRGLEPSDVMHLQEWGGGAADSAGSAASPGRPQPPCWESLYIGRGKKNKISRGDVAGFLMKVGGLTRDEVGRIDVRDHCCYASVARCQVEAVLARLRKQKLKGQSTIVERAR